MASAEADGATEPPLDAAGCEAAVELAGVGVAPELQAEATIANSANGNATRRDVFLVVKADLL
jgi:hypothetical protein